MESENMEKAQKSLVGKSQPSQSSDIKSNSVESNWLPGDMLWARVGRHPFWPCLVVVDPKNAAYLETKKTGRSSQQQIHVQYYGDNGSHSWVSTNKIIRYTGKNNLFKFAQTKKKDKSYSSAFPQPGKNQKWDCAVQESEEESQKPRKERIQFFEEFYPIHTKDYNVKSQVREKGDKSASQKTHLEVKRKEQKPESSGSNSSVVHENILHKRKKRDEENDGAEEKVKAGEGKSVKAEGKSLRKAKRRKTNKKPPGIFEVFVDRCANLFAIDNPEFQADRAKCIRFMRAMWSSMAEDEKSRYHGSYEDIESLKE